MKFFLKSADRGFDILDESAHLKYTVLVMTDRTKQKIIIKNLNQKTVAEISNQKLVFRYFSVKCKGHLYILVPMIKEYFAFNWLCIVFGSTTMCKVAFRKFSPNRGESMCFISGPNNQIHKLL